jgi:hypothetical protein
MEAVAHPADVLPACFVSDDQGVVVFRAGQRSAGELRALAGAADALAKTAGGRRVFPCIGSFDPKEIAPVAKAHAVGRVLAFDEAPGIAQALESAGLRVWKLEGAPDTVFAAIAPPAFAPELRPLSKHADFPTAKSRQVKLTRVAKDAASGSPDDILPEKQIVYGIVLEPETTDSQGDIYSEEEVESAAHKYMEDFQNAGHMHQTLINQSAVVCESYIAPVDFTMGDQPVKKGTWVLAMHILNDALWGQIKDGTLTGFSIGGWAQRVPAQGNEPKEQAPPAGQL